VAATPDAHIFWLGQPAQADTLPADPLSVPGHAANATANYIVSSLFFSQAPNWHWAILVARLSVFQGELLHFLTSS